MKIIGAAEVALELLCKRASSRKAFGKALAELGGNYDVIAKCRNEIEMCRLLTLKAAYMMDTLGNKKAKSEIAQPKVEVPSMAVRVIERAIQIHGGAGVSQDTPLASLYSSIRYLRIGDGPDEVHLRTIAKEELNKYADKWFRPFSVSTDFIESIFLANSISLSALSLFSLNCSESCVAIIILPESVSTLMLSVLKILFFLDITIASSSLLRSST